MKIGYLTDLIEIGTAAFGRENGQENVFSELFFTTENEGNDNSVDVLMYDEGHHEASSVDTIAKDFDMAFILQEDEQTLFSTQEKDEPTKIADPSNVEYCCTVGDSDNTREFVHATRDIAVELECVGKESEADGVGITLSNELEREDPDILEATDFEMVNVGSLEVQPEASQPASSIDLSIGYDLEGSAMEDVRVAEDNTIELTISDKGIPSTSIPVVCKIFKNDIFFSTQ